MVTTPSGLSPAVLADLRGVFARFPEVHEVWLYGSRARGDHRPGSDIDLAVVAPAMSAAHFARLAAELDDLPVAFPMDVLHWDALDNPRLRRHILSDRRRLYPDSPEESGQSLLLESHP